MTATRFSRSALPWIGGKYYSAQRIIGAFPAPDQYDTYVELFGGAAHVLIQKPPYRHVEVYNDSNSDLVNFWMQCRDHGEALEARCRTLPYARALYYAYHASLFDGTELDPLERATRWFYVLRSNFSGQPVEPVANGWSAGIKSAGSASAQAYHSALDLFDTLQQRLRYVMIDCRDFAEVFKQYNKPRTLIYADPPYIDCEYYYRRADGSRAFTRADHERLAALLNSTEASVALSYYPHTLLDAWYPASTWRPITWTTRKHAQMRNTSRDSATELLLCNYPASAESLWRVTELLPDHEQGEEGVHV